jgi:hypothetical protein
LHEEHGHNDDDDDKHMRGGKGGRKGPHFEEMEKTVQCLKEHEDELDEPCMSFLQEFHDMENKHHGHKAWIIPTAICSVALVGGALFYRRRVHRRREAAAQASAEASVPIAQSTELTTKAEPELAQV